MNSSFTILFERNTVWKGNLLLQSYLLVEPGMNSSVFLGWLPVFFSSALYYSIANNTLPFPSLEVYSNGILTIVIKNPVILTNYFCQKYLFKLFFP